MIYARPPQRTGEAPSASDNPLVLTMDQDRVVTAGFFTANVVAADDFNRANETPISVTGNWRRLLNGGTANLSSQRVTGASGVMVISPEGKHLGTIITGQQTGNCAWGDDGSTLYICANHFICRVKTLTKGVGMVNK